MQFKPKDFSKWKEQDVREGIITPLLNRLGYEKDSVNDIRRAEYLSIPYKRNYFGRKKPKTDQILSGEADYILEIDKKIRWVIEAKAPASPITDDDIDQAYHYARHPRVRAVCFCVCNGRELQVFRTDYQPESAELLKIAYEDFEPKFEVIRNVLSPEAMLRTWPSVLIDTGKPLGPGLGSTASVIGGYFLYKSTRV